MPANLPPQYVEAEKAYRSARTPEEKIEALEIMLAIMPKHKGTDKLRAELRARIAKHQIEAERRPSSARKGGGYNIKREGAGQIVLVGMPGVGKSQLVSVLTGVALEVSDHLFTTKTPAPAMMEFENVQIQLVDVPPLTDRDARPWLSNVFRNADALMIVIDLSADPLEQMKAVLKEMVEMKVKPSMDGSGPDDLSLLFVAKKKAMVVGTKNDLDTGGLHHKQLSSAYAAKLPVHSVSAKTGAGLEDLRRAAFDVLDVIRVYTKTPGGRPDIRYPSTVKKGSTVEDVAESVHKDFRNRLRYAQVWGSGKFEGQRVKRDHVLRDGDIVEFHV